MEANIRREENLFAEMHESNMKDNTTEIFSVHKLSDEQFSIEGHELQSQSSKPNTSNEDLTDEPKIGMEFNSVGSAYTFYLTYGKQIGFDVRKQHRRLNVRGVVTSITYCCSREGQKRKIKQHKTLLYTRPITRVGCEAHMTCLLQQNGKYKVTSLNTSHNHELIRTPMKHMLKNNRKLSNAQKAHADDAEKSGISIKSTIELMSREVGGREHLGFMSKDYRNYIHQKRKIAMEKGDAGAILHYFQTMHSENSSFFYSFQLDEDDMITNIFWADPLSVSDYGCFGDVVCFDTTYQTNECGRPFAPFVGVNHHKQTILFGAALLYDETAESFKWLFETFLVAMSGKQPKTILTDQSAAMAKAISMVFLETRHRLCVWHIYQNAAKNLSHVFHASKQFNSDFSKCVYDYEDVDEWLLAWNNMLEKYDLKDNKWLKEIFEIREKWALVFGRHTFTADMKTTQRSESMNNILKKYLMRGYDCHRFFGHYERVLKDRRYEELCADFRMIQTRPTLLSGAELLQHGSEIYTPEVFELFQKEYMGILECSMYKVGKYGMISEYKLSYVGKSREHLVKFDASTQKVCCSCMKFSFTGILCTHALKVLEKKNVKKIPSEYILKRWTREAKARKIASYTGDELHKNPIEYMGKRYGHLCRNFREIASFAAEHEQLTAYAHDRSIELLKDLEELKKKLCLENAYVVNNLKEGDEGNELDVVESEELAKLHGVKRKATIGRPKGRLKGALERCRHKSYTKQTKPPTKRQLAMKDKAEDFCVNNSDEQEQEDNRHEIQPFDINTQQSWINSELQISYLAQEGNRHEVQPFHMNTQASSVGNESQILLSAQTFDATTNFMGNKSFTQLLQESMMTRDEVPLVEEGKDLGREKKF